MNTYSLKLVFAAVAFASFMTSEGRTAVTNLATQAGGPAICALGPRIEFDSTNLNFGTAVAGRAIEHTFTFTNTGAKTLEIADVRPTCGCTVAGAWDRRVEPGHVGNVPIRFTPAGYSDADIFKTVIVLCNDPNRTNIMLQIRGAIWKPIEVKPTFVLFSITNTECRTNQTRVVHIKNNLKEPLVLSKPVCVNHALQASLKTVRPGEEFELEITLAPLKQAGNLTVPVSVTTSSTNLPVITIPVVVSVQATIAATPSEITLSPGPLSSDTQASVTIQNNRAEPLVLSEPQVNVAGVKVKLQEPQPGRRFVLTANFPSGFQIHHDQKIRICVKTNDPKIPVFTVPVFQTRHLTDVLDEQAANSPDSGATSLEKPIDKEFR
jgi:hypothetical protein